MKRSIQAADVDFKFSSQNLEELKKCIKKYPKGRQQSAIIYALELAQRQNNGWISQEALEEVAQQLQMPAIRVYEIVTFYSMFNLSPVGKYVVQVCTTTPCWLRGSDEIMNVCRTQKEKHGNEIFTVMEVECLGACANAPMFQINDDYYEDLDAQSAYNVLEKLATGQRVTPGSCQNRQGAAPMTISNPKESLDG